MTPDDCFQIVLFMTAVVLAILAGSGRMPPKE